MTNRFTAVEPGKTRWVTENEFHCAGLFMKIMAFLMPGAFKKQTLRYMQNFKAFAESGASVRDDVVKAPVA